MTQFWCKLKPLTKQLIVQAIGLFFIIIGVIALLASFKTTGFISNFELALGYILVPNSLQLIFLPPYMSKILTILTPAAAAQENLTMRHFPGLMSYCGKNIILGILIYILSLFNGWLSILDSLALVWVGGHLTMMIFILLAVMFGNADNEKTETSSD